MQPNTTGNETRMMCSSHGGIRVERHLFSICQPNKGLVRSSKDWTLMLQSYLILSLEVFNEDWIRRLPNQDHCRPLYVQCVGLRIIQQIQSENFETF